MSDIISRRSDLIGKYSLDLGAEISPIWIGIGIGVNHLIRFGNQFQCNGEVPFKNLVYPGNRRIDRCQCICNGASVVFSVFPRGGTASR